MTRHTRINMSAPDDEMRRLRQELADTQQRLEELASVHSTFVATFSHDIKNPLTTIMGRVELLKRLASRQAIVPADIARHLDPLESAVNRLATLIQSFSITSDTSSKVETAAEVDNNAV